MGKWDVGSDFRKQYQREWRKSNPNYNKDWKGNNPAFIDNGDEYRELGPYWIKHTLSRVKSVAKRKGIPFNLEAADLVVPTHCPVLGLKLLPGRGKGGMKDCSPSLDRIIPDLGYVKGNVIIVSNKANRIKSDATPAEIAAVAKFYTNLCS